jgi:endonuclease G
MVKTLRRARNAPPLQLEGAAPFTPGEQAWFDSHNPHGAPKYNWTGDRTLIARQGYSLSHNNADRIADWVAFRIEAVNVVDTPKRTDDFRPDPAVPAHGRAQLSDYKKSGFDRGHQCAASDSQGRGKTVMSESFFLSNMTPQRGPLNQKGWRDLEIQIRDWAKTRKDLWVVTGPAFYEENDTDGWVEYDLIGANGVAVPTHYFKVVLDVGDNGEFDALAFFIPNQKMTKPASGYLTSIDEIERITGLDLFPGLDPLVQEPLEAKKPTQVWN